MGNKCNRQQEKRDERSSSTHSRCTGVVMRRSIGSRSQDPFPVRPWRYERGKTRADHSTYDDAKFALFRGTSQIPSSLSSWRGGYGTPFMQQTHEGDRPERHCNRHVKTILIVTTVCVVLAVIVAIVTAALLIKGTNKQYVRAEVTARVINVNYSSKLADTTSNEFLSLQNDFCSQVGYVADADSRTSGYKGCRIDSAKNGSVILVVIFYFDVMESTVEGVKAVVLRIFIPSDSTSNTVKVATFIIAVREDDVSVVVVDETTRERPAVLPARRSRETLPTPVPTSSATDDIEVSTTETVSSSKPNPMTSDITIRTEEAATPSSSVFTLHSSSSTTALETASQTSDLKSILSSGMSESKHTTGSPFSLQSTSLITISETTSSVAVFESVSPTPASASTTSATNLESASSSEVKSSTPYLESATSTYVFESASSSETTSSTPYLESVTSTYVFESASSSEATSSTPYLESVTSTYVFESASSSEATSSTPYLESATSTTILESTSSLEAKGSSPESTSSLRLFQSSSSVKVKSSTPVIVSTDSTAIESPTPVSESTGSTTISESIRKMTTIGEVLTSSTGILQSSTSTAYLKATSSTTDLYSTGADSEIIISTALSTNALKSTDSVDVKESTRTTPFSEIKSVPTILESIKISVFIESTGSTSLQYTDSIDIPKPTPVMLEPTSFDNASESQIPNASFESTVPVTNSKFLGSSTELPPTSLINNLDFKTSTASLEYSYSTSSLYSQTSATVSKSIGSLTALESASFTTALNTKSVVAATDSITTTVMFDQESMDLAPVLEPSSPSTVFESSRSTGAMDSPSSSVESTSAVTTPISSESTSLSAAMDSSTATLESKYSISVVDMTSLMVSLESGSLISHLEVTRPTSSFESTMSSDVLEISTGDFDSIIPTIAVRSTSSSYALQSTWMLDFTTTFDLASSVNVDLRNSDYSIVAPSSTFTMKATSSVDAIQLTTSSTGTKFLTSIDSVKNTNSVQDVEPTSSSTAVDTSRYIVTVESTSSVYPMKSMSSVAAVDTPSTSASLEPSPVVWTSATEYDAAYTSIFIGSHHTTMLGESLITNTKSVPLMLVSSSEIATPSLSQAFSDMSTSSSIGDMSSAISVNREEDSSIMKSSYVKETPGTGVTPTWSSNGVETLSSLSVTSSIEPSPTSGLYSSSALPLTTPRPVVLAMSDVSVYEKEAIKLVCRVEGNYTVNSVQFEKDGKTLQGSTEISENNTVFSYTIQESSCYDTGQYACIVTGKDGNFTAPAEVSVQVESGEPTLTIPFEIVEGRWKETSLFICTYKQGIPEAEVFWSGKLANGTTIERLNFETNYFVEENQNDTCALEATSQFYYAFSMGYNGSSICCNVKQGGNVTSACDDIYVIESSMCINQTGYFEHPYSCQIWIECVNDIVYMNKCPQGLCIDVATRVCVTGTGPTEKNPEDPFSCKGRPTSYIPRSNTYPHNCKDYHWCVNGLPNKGTCQGNSYLALNTTSSTCTSVRADSYCAKREAEEASSRIVPSLTIPPPSLMNPTPSISDTLSTSEVDMTSVPTVSMSTIEPTPTVWSVSSTATPTTTTTPPPVVTMADVTVNRGDDVVLVCKVEGNFTLDTVQFVKDGEPLAGSPVIGVDYRYTVTNTTCTDSGTYSCSVTGEEGNFTVRAQVIVQVIPGAPTLKLPFEIVENKEKPETPFTCTYKQGYPAEVAYWTATLADGTVMENPAFSNLENSVAENQTDECSQDATSQFSHGFSMEWNASRICCNVKQGETVLSACDDVYVVPGDICKGDKYYKHPYSCQLWIECVGSTIYVSSCKEGECYNIESGICDQDLSSGPEGEFSCDGRVTGAIIAREYTYPDHCKDYYQCANNARSNLTCPPGTYFLAVRTEGNCGFVYADSYCAEKAGVNGTESTTAAASNSTTATPSKCDCGTYEYIPVEYTHPNNCTNYYRCVNGVKYEYPCGSGTEVNYRIAETSTTCVFPVSGNSYCDKVKAGEMEACGIN